MCSSCCTPSRVVVVLASRKSFVFMRLLMGYLVLLTREAGTLYVLFGFFDSLAADSVCRRRGYQVETATNRDANATTSRSNWARASLGLAQSKSWTCQYSTRSTHAGNCSASIQRCSVSFKAMIKFARPSSCSVTCTGNRMLPFR